MSLPAPSDATLSSSVIILSIWLKLSHLPINSPPSLPTSTILVSALPVVSYFALTTNMQMKLCFFFSVKFRFRQTIAKYMYVCVVVVLTLIRIIKSVVTGQAPVILEWYSDASLDTYHDLICSSMSLARTQADYRFHFVLFGGGE